MNKHESPNLISTLLTGYQWAALFLLGVLAWAGKELYGVVITKQFERLRHEMSERYEHQDDQIAMLRKQNESLLQIMSDMRVNIAIISTKLEDRK